MTFDKEKANSWIEDGKSIASIHEKLDNKAAGIHGSDAFLYTYNAAYNNATPSALKESYDLLYKMKKNLPRTPKDYQTILSDYVGNGRILFVNNGIPSDLIPYLQSKMRNTQAEEAERRRREQERQRLQQEEAERKRRQDEQRRRQQQQEEQQRRQRQQQQEEEQRRQEQEHRRRAQEIRESEARKHKFRTGCIVVFVVLVVLPVVLNFVVGGIEHNNRKKKRQQTERVEPAQNTSTTQTNSTNRTSQTTAKPTTASTNEAKPAQAQPTVDRAALEKVMPDLRKQFSAANGKSTAQSCAEYGDVEGLQYINGLLKKAERAAPGDSEVKGYRRTFNYILKQHNIKL